MRGGGGDLSLLPEQHIVKSEAKQRIYRFPNGWGASVITNWMAYSRYELAVIRFLGDDPGDFELDYTTPVTSDVEPFETARGVISALKQIEGLPPAKVAPC